MNNTAHNKTAARNKAARESMNKLAIFAPVPTFKPSPAGPMDAATHAAIAKHIKPGTYSGSSFEGKFLMDSYVSDELLAQLEAEG